MQYNFSTVARARARVRAHVCVRARVRGKRGVLKPYCISIFGLGSDTIVTKDGLVLLVATRFEGECISCIGRLFTDFIPRQPTENISSKFSFSCVPL